MVAPPANVQCHVSVVCWPLIPCAHATRTRILVASSTVFQAAQSSDPLHTLSKKQSHRAEVRVVSSKAALDCKTKSHTPLFSVAAGIEAIEIVAGLCLYIYTSSGDCCPHLVGFDEGGTNIVGAASSIGSMIKTTQREAEERQTGSQRRMEFKHTYAFALILGDRQNGTLTVF